MEGSRLDFLLIYLPNNLTIKSTYKGRLMCFVCPMNPRKLAVNTSIRTQSVDAFETHISCAIKDNLSITHLPI